MADPKTGVGEIQNEPGVSEAKKKKEKCFKCLKNNGYMSKDPGVSFHRFPLTRSGTI